MEGPDETEVPWVGHRAGRSSYIAPDDHHGGVWGASPGGTISSRFGPEGTIGRGTGTGAEILLTTFEAESFRIRLLTLRGYPASIPTRSGIPTRVQPRRESTGRTSITSPETGIVTRFITIRGAGAYFIIPRGDSGSGIRGGLVGDPHAQDAPPPGLPTGILRHASAILGRAARRAKRSRPSRWTTARERWSSRW